MWRNTITNYGIIAISFHWLMAIAVIGLFVLGLWMVDLSYYDPWYMRAPAIHKAVGVLIFAALVARFVWRQVNPKPAPEFDHGTIERIGAALAHYALYLLMLGVVVSGYLIPTAEGRPVDVFGWFEIPALVYGLPDQAEIAGDVHLILAIALVVLAGIHALAALKHHVLDRDRTLLKMLGR